MATTFLSLQVYEDFSTCSKAHYFTVRCRIWPKFDLCREYIVVLVTCKNEEDPIKNKGARVATRLYVDFLDVQGQITPRSMVGSGINSNSFKHLCIS